MKFALFDAVELTESTTLAEGQIVPVGSKGAIVEVFNQGEAYLVELFGQWIRPDHTGRWLASDANHKDAFVDTRGVALLTANQMRLFQPAAQTVGERTRLLFVVDKLPESLVKEVADFAEFLQHKAEQQTVG